VLQVLLLYELGYWLLGGVVLHSLHVQRRWILTVEVLCVALNIRHYSQAHRHAGALAEEGLVVGVGCRLVCNLGFMLELFQLLPVHHDHGDVLLYLVHPFEVEDGLLGVKDSSPHHFWRL